MSYEQKHHKNKLQFKHYIQLYSITQGTWLDSDMQNNLDIGECE